MAKYFLILFLAYSFQVSAQDREPAAVDETMESEMDVKVKTRNYPGGIDEGELKVQPNLAQPVRKVTPTVEEGSEENQERD